MDDKVYQALVYLLWRHQGGHSELGQSIRSTLGKGQFDRMTTSEVATARIVDSKLDTGWMEGNDDAG